MERRQRKAPIAVVAVDRVMELWATELTVEQICESLGIRRSALADMRGNMGLPKRKARKSWHAPHLTKPRPDPDVSPEEVQHRMAKCQARWTDEMFVLRSIGRVRPLPYEFPTISLGRLG